MGNIGIARGARAASLLTLVVALNACSIAEHVAGGPAPSTTMAPMLTDSGEAPPRVSGEVIPEGADPEPRPRIVYSDRTSSGRLNDAAGPASKSGDMTVNFTDTDIREVVRVILGDLLKVTYTIDPAVKGTATLQTAQPVDRDVLLQLLESLLAQNNAQVVRRGAIYNVVPVASGVLNLQPGGAGSNAAESSEIVMLRYASAADLAKMLEPYVAPGSKIAVGPAKNSLLINGTAPLRRSLVALIKSFDVDILAGQSYAIFPVKSAEPEKVADEVQHYVQAGGGSETNGPVHVMALDRINAVLVVAQEPAYLERVGRFIEQVDAVGDSTERRLHVYYVQNVTAVGLASLLQKAFAPQTAGGNGNANNVGSLAPNAEAAVVSAPGSGSTQNQTQGQSSSTTLSSGGSSGIATSPAGSTGTAGSSGGMSQSSNQSAQKGSAATPEEPETPVPAKGIRFIADKKNNALLIFATPSEYNMIAATLRKIDILPLQVLVEATIMEVTLNDNLEYGTQYFFKKGASSLTLTNAATNAIAPVFPGFAYAFSSSNAQVAISALQQVTKVKVVSDPQLLVLNNESARLLVGALVPIVTQSAVSVDTVGAPVVNSVAYQETGVILEVTPRVNSGGLVTLDISQEVSDVVQTSTSTIDSPTINERRIKSSIVVQDGETIGLGGLITNSVTTGNAGIPWLTNIPVLGALFGTRNNQSARTELLVLLTPRVLEDQRTARALTDDLRGKLGGLSALPDARDPIEPPGPLRP